MTLSPAILDSQEYARRLVLKLDGSVLPYDEDLGGFTIDTATPIFVTRGTAAARAALSGDPGQLFYETDTSVLLEWTNAAAWKAVAAPGAWTSASYPTPANTDAAYEGLRVYETDTGKTVVFRRTTLGVAIGGGNPLIWIQVSPVTTTGIDITGVGTTASPFVGAVRNREQLANPYRNASGAIWQRGTSVTPAAGAFGPDGYVNYSRSDIVWSRQLSGDTQGSGYCIRVQRPNGNAVTTATAIGHSVLTADSVRFGGRQATFSLRVRKGSGASVSLDQAYLYTGTGTDESAGVGFTGAVPHFVSVPALTTSWQTISVTATLGASVTQVAAWLALNWSGTAGASDWFEFKDLRLDEGAYAQEHVPLPYAQDLAECRYFFRRDQTAPNQPVGFGIVTGATTATVQIPTDTPMRTTPTISVVGTIGNMAVNDAGAAPALTALAGSSTSSPSEHWIDVTAGGGGLTQGRACRVYTTGTVSVDRSAEI